MKRIFSIWILLRWILEGIAKDMDSIFYNKCVSLSIVFLFSGWALRVLTVASWMWIFPPRELVRTHFNADLVKVFIHLILWQKLEEHLAVRRQPEVEGSLDRMPGSNTWGGKLLILLSLFYWLGCMLESIDLLSLSILDLMTGSNTWGGIISLFWLFGMDSWKQ